MMALSRIVVAILASGIFWSVNTKHGKIEHHHHMFVACPGSSVLLNASRLVQSTNETDPSLAGTPIIWSRPNDEIIGTKEGFGFNKHRKILKLEDVRPTDSGVYSAYKADKFEKIQFHLKVPDTSLRLIDTKTNISVEEYDRVVLKIRALLPGNSSWVFQHQLLTNTGNKSRHFFIKNTASYGIPYGSVLEIHKIEKRHQGVYAYTHNVEGCSNAAKIFIHVTPRKDVKSRFNHSYFSILGFALRFFIPKVARKSAFFFILLITVILSVACSCVCLMWIIDIRKMLKQKREKKKLTDVNFEDTEIDKWTNCFNFRTRFRNLYQHVFHTEKGNSNIRNPFSSSYFAGFHKRFGKLYQNILKTEGEAGVLNKDEETPFLQSPAEVSQAPDFPDIHADGALYTNSSESFHSTDSGSLGNSPHQPVLAQVQPIDAGPTEHHVASVQNLQNVEQLSDQQNQNIATNDL